MKKEIVTCDFCERDMLDGCIVVKDWLELRRSKLELWHFCCFKCLELWTIKKNNNQE